MKNKIILSIENLSKKYQLCQLRVTHYRSPEFFAQPCKRIANMFLHQKANRFST